jgi:hypothetical protein
MISKNIQSRNQLNPYQIFNRMFSFQGIVAKSWKNHGKIMAKSLQNHDNWKKQTI